MKIVFNKGSHDKNMHGPGHAVIRGPKFRMFQLLSVHLPSTGYRFIFYKPSGAWIYLDVYFDRRVW